MPNVLIKCAAMLLMAAPATHRPATRTVAPFTAVHTKIEEISAK